MGERIRLSLTVTLGGEEKAVLNLAESLYTMRTRTLTFHLCYRDVGGVEDKGERPA